MIVRLLSTAIDIYFYLIIAHVIFSWIPVRQPWLVELRDLVHRLTEPYLGIFRRFVPIIDLGGAGLDLSPLVGILVLQILGRFVIGLLAGLPLP
ncbi:MAG: YggT family protein [Actinobacteria bacterium]|nr:MAG: YggT family protein [Actinomycetota bacterium]